MQRTFKFFLPLMLLTLFLSCKKDGPEEPDPGNQKDITTVDQKITDFMTRNNVPGASLAVSKDGKLVYRKGYGKANTTTNEAVTTEHRFRLASLTKTFAAVSALKLAQDGKLNLDSKVFGAGGLLGTDYGTGPYNTNLSNITLRHLLNHTSGSWGANTGGDVMDLNPTYNNKQLMDWIVNSRTNPRVPGTFYNYSNTGFFIAGRVIEKVAGKPYMQYLRNEILAPLGITQIELASTEKKSNEVTYYGQGGTAGYEYNFGLARRDADGGLMGTATDVLKFILAVDGFPTRPDILNSNSITQFTTAPVFNPSYALGLGKWGAEGVWTHNGMLPGTRTAYMRKDNGMAAVLLLNTSPDYTILSKDQEFARVMQALMLDLVKNNTDQWQDIDQF